MDTRNVTKEFKIPEPDIMMLAILNKQRRLADEYMHIEKFPAAPWSLQKADHQVWVKDFCWRVTEELAEALEYYPKIQDDKDAEVLFYEEISDAFHFLLEPIAMLHKTVDLAHKHLIDKFFPEIPGEARPLNMPETIQLLHDINKEKPISFMQAMLETIYHMGLACNCLKNKKWKRTQVLTDEDKFWRNYHTALYSFFTLCVSLGLSADDIYTIYMKKATVNEFRQRTNY